MPDPLTSNPTTETTTTPPPPPRAPSATLAPAPTPDPRAELARAAETARTNRDGRSLMNYLRLRRAAAD